MKKHIDGRTVKGLRIKQQGRESILAAYGDLLRSGVPAPTVRQTADRAGLSLRAIFNHFPDLRALRLASFHRMQALSNEFFSEELPPGGSLAERFRQFVKKQTQRLEFVTPLHRTAAMVESVDPDVARAMQEARAAAARELARALGPALRSFSEGERRALLMKLHLVCCWESWDFLRKHYQLSPRRACAIMTDVALAVLATAENS